jgi:alpha-D-ribose 1-methylphosphonate 5-triphosphate synthase subunit PhnH
MLSIFATNATFQPAMFWLKRDAPWNIAAMLDTDATLHLLMSALNADADGELKGTFHCSCSITPKPVAACFL